MSKYTDIQGRSNTIYGDTDSAYVTLEHFAKREGIEMDEEKAIELATLLGEALKNKVREEVPNLFLSKPEPFQILVPGLEIVGKKGMFSSAKKRYAVSYFFEENKRIDGIKSKGIETKRTDTPKAIQKLLEKFIEMVLIENRDYEYVARESDEVVHTLRNMEPWKLGTPGTARNVIEKQNDMIEKASSVNENAFSSKRGKTPLHYYLKAAINTNMLIEKHKGHSWSKIIDGDKIEVLPVKNELGIVALKVDEADLMPDWFKQLPFDVEAMIEKIWIKKLNNIFEGMGWVFKLPVLDPLGEEEEW